MKGGSVLGWYGLLLSLAAALPLSNTKGGGLQTRECPPPRTALYPENQPPHTWDGCGRDVYRQTWRADADGLLASLSVSKQDLLKLTKTMGFCPHKRCQLGNVSAQASGCPQGLCYTKIENGALSYGACCFTDNAFISRDLIGFYNKTQQTPKPIYRASRIILGKVYSPWVAGEIEGDDETYDSSYEAFINANKVAPGIIATQCPLKSTLEDAKRMIIEQNVSLWIQLSPFSVAGSQDKATGRECTVFPLEFDGARISREAGYTNFSYTLTARIKRMGKYLYTNFSLTDVKVEKEGGNGLELRTRTVEHLWFHGWADFVIPSREFLPALEVLVDKAARVVVSGGTVVVSCISGRGRSGTFSALVAGRVARIDSVSQLVDLVVSMRRARDGLVETPRQFHLIAQVLNLSEKPRPDVVFFALALAVVLSWTTIIRQSVVK
jgi:protein tyrosine phosphatase